MKKLVLMLTVFLFLSVPAFAEDRPMSKLTRGVTNVATSPLEIPKQAIIYGQEGYKKTPHVLVWIFSGIVKGHVNMVKRIGSGLWDVVSFPFAKPKDYEPLFKPGYVYEDWQFYR